MRDTDAFARLASVAGAHGVTPGALDGPVLGYRHRARLAVRGRAGSPKVGIFQEGSHRIVDIPRCGVHHPQVNATAAVVRDAIRHCGVEPYVEGPHRGLVRYLQITVDPGTQRVQLVVVTNDAGPDSARPLLGELVERLGDRLHSLAWNGQPLRSNAVLGPRTELIHGPPALELAIGGAHAHFPPAAFMQNNLPLYGRIVEQVHAWVPDGARVVEYYAGVGAIGLGVVGRSATVAFNELAAASLEGLGLGLAALPPSLRERTRVLEGDAALHAGALRDADTVIVDPPRRGLDGGLLDALCEQPVGSLLYVSCGLSSFERDTAALTGRGDYRLDALVVADLFPFTGHVESVARFVAG